MSSVPHKSSTGLQLSVSLGLFYAVFFLAGFLAIFLVAEWLLQTSIASKKREIISERLAEYRASFLRGRVEELRTRFRDQNLRNDDLVFVRIEGPGASLLLFSNPRGRRFLDPAELDRLAGPPIVTTLVTGDPRNIWTIASATVQGTYLLQAGRISTGAFRPVETFRRAFLWSIVPATLVALLAGGLLSYRAVKPARDLTRTVREILSTGALDKRVPLGRRRDDFTEMGRLFNQLLERNEALIRSMREALDNTSHDLRTPLTRLRAGAESALARHDDPSAAREALADSLEESERILRMLDTLMDIAEAETGTMPLDIGKLDLPPLIREVVELYEVVAEENGILVETRLPPELLVMADPARLQQVVANLLDNALKYGNHGGKVDIEAHAAGDTAEIRVRDDGPGIPTDELPRIFDRLYRGDRSRSKRGLGLGLSFVRAVVDAHHGAVTVDSRPGHGTTFTVRLPRT